MSQNPTDTAGPRNQLDLMKAQVAAVEAWAHALRAAEKAADAAAVTREMRLDLTRRAEARRREHAAVIARADEQLRASGRLMSRNTAPRAILAHRNEWLRGRVAARLEELGVRVVGVFDDGADAAGTLVAEQPDLVLVEDRLPTLSGLDVVRRARDYAPGSVVAAQVMDSSGVDVMVAAGAEAVFTRQVPPDEIADQLFACLGSDRRLVLA